MICNQKWQTESNRVQNRILMRLLVILVYFVMLFSSSVLSQSSAPENRRPPVLIDRAKSDTAANQRIEQNQSYEDSEDDEVIRIDTSLVTIPVSVTDRYGRFISDLRKEEFQVFEDDIPQKIEYFASVEQPFTVILLLDVSGSTWGKMDEIKEAAIAFTNQLRGDDKVGIWAFSEHVDVLCRPTSDRRILRSAIMRARNSGGTNLYDAVMMALKESETFEGRKAIILFTDGVDTGSIRNSEHTTLRKAEESNTVIYTIRYDTYSDVSYRTSPSRVGSIFDILFDAIFGRIISGPGTSRQEYEKGKRYLQELAFVSSGRYYEANITNLSNAFAMIAEELRRQYTLGYYPENIGKPGQRRRIKVRVMRPNLVVRAKNSYIVGQANTTNTAKLPSQPAQQISSSPIPGQPQQQKIPNPIAKEGQSQPAQQSQPPQQAKPSASLPQSQQKTQQQNLPQLRRLPF
jgi:Ca-activated chloride channel family protein